MHNIGEINNNVKTRAEGEELYGVDERVFCFGYFFGWVVMGGNVTDKEGRQRERRGNGV